MSPELIIILTAIMVAVPCALVGTFLVLRKMAMLGDAISHVVLPGIAVAFFMAGGPAPLPVLIGAAACGLLTVVLVEALYRSGRVKEDSSIGLVFPAFFAFGVFLVSRFGADVHLDTQHVLYGEIALAPWDTLIVGNVALGPRALWILGTITLLDLAFIMVFYKELKLVSFDSGLAAALGFSPLLLHYGLMAMVSITTVAAFESVGAILVVALLIVPPATAYLLTDRLSRMLLLAVAVGALSAVLGYLLARMLDASIAGAMATMAGVLFALAALASPRYGFLASLARQGRLRQQFAADLLVVHLVQQEQLGRAAGAAGARDGLTPALPTAGLASSAPIASVTSPSPTDGVPSSPAPVRPSAPAAVHSAPIAAVQARFRWSDRFTRRVVGQLIAAGLVQSAAGSPQPESARIAVTELGRARAAELLAI